MDDRTLRAITRSQWTSRQGKEQEEEAYRRERLVCLKAMLTRRASMQKLLSFLLGIQLNAGFPIEMLNKVLEHYVCLHEPRLIKDFHQRDDPEARLCVTLGRHATIAADLRSGLEKTADLLLKALFDAAQSEPLDKKIRSVWSQIQSAWAVNENTISETLTKEILKNSTSFASASFNTSQTQLRPLPAWLQEPEMTRHLRHLDLTIELNNVPVSYPTQLYAAQDHIQHLKKIPGLESVTVLHLGVIERIGKSQRLLLKRGSRSQFTNLEVEMVALVQSMRCIQGVETHFSFTQPPNNNLHPAPLDIDIEMLDEDDKGVVEAAMKWMGATILIKEGKSKQVKPSPQKADAAGLDHEEA